MARPRAFDAREALTTVRALFWSQGFAATSMQDVTRATGIGRQSLYDTFGSKEELFEAALREYQGSMSARVSGALVREGSMRERLTGFFDLLIDVLLAGGGRGCLLANSLAEKHQVGAGPRAVLDQNMREMERALRDCVRAAQRAGEIPSQPPAPVIAAFLFNAVLGLSGMARLGTGRRRLREIAQLALDALG